MKTIPLGTSSLMVPTLAVGCMRLPSLSERDAEAFLRTAIDAGANFFDHADIYGGGKSEELFASALHLSPIERGKVLIQSKCGIRKGLYDFSKAHILTSVDGILKRLKTDYLDVLLLHRPDALMEPDEVAEAFDALESSGKVRHFGVSNQNPMQMELLAQSLHQPILVNQLQFGAAHTGMIDAGVNVNMKNDAGINRDGGVLDYCRLKTITIQPWSPFQYGFFEGVFIGSDKYPALNDVLRAMAGKYGATPTSIAFAWILRHPAHMQPITGTMNSQRLLECVRASDISLTREDWYEIYRAAGNQLP